MNNQKLTEIERVLALARGAGQLETPPEWLEKSVIASWVMRNRTNEVQTGGGVLERLLAVLRFDSYALSPMAQGVRSGHRSVRQLLFSARDCDIDIRIAPARGNIGRTWQVSGQVLGPQSNGSVFLEGMQAKQKVVVDELGEFQFEAVNEGDYTMTLDLVGAAIVLPLFRLPP